MIVDVLELVVRPAPASVCPFPAASRAAVIRVRRSSNLYQYKSNRSASSSPSASAYPVRVCADLMFFFFLLFVFD